MPAKSRIQNKQVKEAVNGLRLKSSGWRVTGHKAGISPVAYQGPSPQSYSLWVLSLIP